LERYVDAVVNAKDRGLPVLLGLEVDFFPESIDEVAAFLEPYPWDFLIGSVHWVGGWSIDHGDVAYEFDRRGVERAWEEYFELETELAASGAVDVLAHADVVKKHGFRPAVEPRHLYRAVAEAASASGTAVELNTNGLNMAAAEIYPSPAFLAAFFEAGVPITFGSDAHVPQRVAESFDAAADLARATGYAGRVRFSGRHPVPVSLG
jgi:histidinol-phosphatase (PHP family)